MIDSRLRAAWRFFKEHAGYCTPPGQAACALDLARAERVAKDEGCTWEWVPDDQPWDSDDDYEPDEVLGCILRDESGSVLASLWGIGDPSAEYRRVVEAELAQEALDHLVPECLQL